MLNSSWSLQAILKYPTSYAIGEVKISTLVARQRDAYLYGAKDFKDRVLEMLKENHLACLDDKPLSEFDAERMKAINEVYEDLISIVENLNAEDKSAHEKSILYDNR